MVYVTAMVAGFIAGVVPGMCAGFIAAATIAVLCETVWKRLAVRERSGRHGDDGVE
jgi:hypothetical protein